MWLFLKESNVPSPEIVSQKKIFFNFQNDSEIHSSYYNHSVLSFFSLWRLFREKIRIISNLWDSELNLLPTLVYPRVGFLLSSAGFRHQSYVKVKTMLIYLTITSYYEPNRFSNICYGFYPKVLLFSSWFSTFGCPTNSSSNPRIRPTRDFWQKHFLPN